MMLPLLLGIFLLWQIFNVPPNYVAMKVVLGILGGLCAMFGLLPLWLRSR